MDIQLYKERMYNIIGAAMSLYNELGCGYSELIYQECLAIVCSEKYIHNELTNKYDLIRG